ncbi:septum formation protein Maf [archaeon]|nr:septum formation protein Maf [archaeon]
MRIILASQSVPRRKALDILGLKYDVIPSSVDEKAIRDTDPYALARKLSEAKAKAVGESNPSSLVIAADCLVVCDQKVYEKPASTDEALRMLKGFSGKTVEIIGGLAVYNSTNGKMLSTVEKDIVKFRQLTDHEVKDYVSRYHVTKFAGGFDGDGLVRFAESCSGKNCFLLALPMNELILFLKENGVTV